MKSSIPRVSIGMPVYNGEQYIACALDSLLKQTFADFELIISDNASTDGTEQICRSYADRDPRIRYERHEENQGAIWNFNHVFEVARGEYFKWASHDDICSPTLIQRAVEVLDRDPATIWCHSQSTHIDPTGAPIDQVELVNVSYVAHGDALVAAQSPQRVPTRTSPRPHQRFAAVVLGSGGCLDSYGLFRAEVIRKTPLYMPYFGAEKVFIAEIGLLGRFHEIPETLFFPRIHPDAAGSQSTSTGQQAAMAPQRARRFSFTRFYLVKGYCSAISRAGLPVGERLRCYKVLLRYLLQIKKWKSILMRTLAGSGLSDSDRLKHVQVGRTPQQSGSGQSASSPQDALFEEEVEALT